LSSFIDKQLKKIEQHIIHGNYQEILPLVEEGLKTKDISRVDELNLLLQRSLSLFMLGNFRESIQLASEIYEESMKTDNDLLKVDASFRLLLNSNWVGRFSEGLEIADNGLEILLAIKDHPKKALAWRKAQLLVWKAVIINQLGDFNKALELFKEALSAAEKSEYKQCIAFVNIRVGTLYHSLGELKRAEDYYKIALEIATEIGNRFFIGNVYGHLANIKRNKREYQEAIKLFEKQHAIAKEIGTTLLLMSMHDLGLVYLALFQLDKAIEYFLVSIKYCPGILHVVYANIALVYTWKYEFEKAKEYYHESLEICEEINDRRMMPFVLANLARIAIELGDISEAQKFNKRLEKINKETGFEHINRIYRFSTIQLLNAKGTLSDLGKAVALLEEFMKEDELPFNWRLDVLYLYLEIRLKDLQLNNTSEALKEVQKRLHYLEVEAEDKQLRWLLANVYRLQSQLAIVELDAQKAIELLDKAQTIAKEIDVELLKVKLKEDRMKIEQQLDMLRELQEKQAPLSEKMKLVSLKNTIKDIAKETVIEERDEETGKIIEYRKLFSLKI